MSEREPVEHSSVADLKAIPATAPSSYLDLSHDENIIAKARFVLYCRSP